MNQVSPAFIVSPPEFSLPSSLWKPFKCCRTRDEACLLSLRAPTVPLIEPVSWETLERIHPAEHLRELRTSRRALFDVYYIEVKDGPVTDDDERNVLTPLRRSVARVIAGARAVFPPSGEERRKKIVIVPEGGSHHASPFVAEGSCMFCDVPLAWLTVKRPGDCALYIDTDVHHANGFAQARADLPELRDSFFMVDLFNEDIWPFVDDDDNRVDVDTVEHVNIPVPFHSHIRNRAYLDLLRQALRRVERELPPVHMVFYMCSNDAMKGDTLGQVDVTDEAIYQRDRMVVEWAHARDLPIVVMPSRGYGSTSCRVARESMERLNDEYDIF